MFIKHIFSYLLLAFSLPALADEYPLEFKLLGPAFSHHGNRDDATYDPKTAHVNCRPYSEAELLQLVRERGGFVGGIPEKCTYPDVPKREWNELNAAIGLEISKPDATGRYLAFANIVRDSYYQPGLMLGAGRAWEWDWASTESFEIEYGVSAGLWNRHVKTRMDYPTREICTERLGQVTCRVSKYNWGEKVAVTKRRWVPFLLPFISVTHRDSGIGLNVSVIPKLGKYNTATTAIAQLTYKF